jgi:predicted metalloprotease
MRLGPFDPNNIRVRRGGGGGGLPIGGAGGVGCGTIVIARIAYFVFGADPSQFLGGQATGPEYSETAGQPGGETGAQICNDNQYATEACNALSSLNSTWQPVFQQAGVQFAQPTLVFYQGGTRSGCGNASSSMGPFYCPGDQSIYIDTSFYDEMNRKLGAGPGDFARYYVIAHEYGHHVQNLTGVAQQVSSAMQQNPRQANQLSVLLELQADCYAGVWAGKNRNLIEPGDFEEGMQAANAIGDDTLTHGAVAPDNFTHGTSQQRMAALRTGMQSADDTQCDRIVQAG